MSIALSFALAPVALFGLGLPLLATRPDLSTRADRLQAIGSVGALGLTIYYALALIFRDLALWLAITAVLSSICWGAFLVLRARDAGTLFKIGPLFATLIGFGLLLYALMAVLQPLTGFDGWAFWFFHGEIIWTEGGLYDDGAFANAIDVPAASYPKLLATLIAGLVWGIGFWNEYLPKFALVLLVWPACFLALSLQREGWAAATIAIALLFASILAQHLSGSMDGALTAYGALGIFFLARAVEQGRREDWLTAAACLGVASGLKLDAYLMLVALVPALLVARLVLRAKLPRLRPRDWAFMILPFLGWAIWTIERDSFAFANPAGLASDNLATFVERIGDPTAWRIILSGLFFHSPTLNGLLPAILALLLLAHFERAALRGIRILLPLMVAALYLGGLIAIYLGTQADLVWHVNTSARRASLFVWALVGSLAIIAVVRLDRDANLAQPSR